MLLWPSFYCWGNRFGNLPKAVIQIQAEVQQRVCIITRRLPSLGISGTVWSVSLPIRLPVHFSALSWWFPFPSGIHPQTLSPVPCSYEAMRDNLMDQKWSCTELCSHLINNPCYSSNRYWNSWNMSPRLLESEGELFRNGYAVFQETENRWNERGVVQRTATFSLGKL